MQTVLKLFLDFTPLAGFFIAYKLFGMSNAIMVLVGLTLISLIFSYLTEKRIAPLPAFSALILLVFGGLSLMLQDEVFIKLKPTIVNLLFAAILFSGLLRGKALLKFLFEAAFSMTDEGWMILSRRWAWFFIFLAVLNEVVWRNFPTDFWVNFKVFGMFSLTMIFTFLQLPLMKRYALPD